MRSNHSGVFDTYLIGFKNTSLLMSVLQFGSCICFQHRQSLSKMEDLMYPLSCLHSYIWGSNPHFQIVSVNWLCFITPHCSFLANWCLDNKYSIFPPFPSKNVKIGLWFRFSQPIFNWSFQFFCIGSYSLLSYLWSCHSIHLFFYSNFRLMFSSQLVPGQPLLLILSIQQSRISDYPYFYHYYWDLNCKYSNPQYYWWMLRSSSN